MNLNSIKITRTAEDEKFATMRAEARAINDGWNAGRFGLPTLRAHAVVEINATGTVFPYVAVYGAYDVRDALKARGYKFYGATKSWYTPRESVADAKAEELAATIGIQLGSAMTREDHAAESAK